MNLSVKPDSIWDIVQTQGATYGEKPFVEFIEDGYTLSYRGAAERAGWFGKGLLEHGVTGGAKVGMLMRTSALYVYAWFATLGAALVDVPINPEFRGALLRHALHRMDVTALVADREGLEALQSLSAEVRAQLALVVVPDDVYEEAAAGGSALEGIGRLVPLSAVEAAGRESTRTLPEIDSRGLASIRFSSGTTGMPKGIMMDHGHMLASARKFNAMMDFGSGDVMYTCFPFYHVLSTITGVLSTMCAGGSIVVSKKFSASRFWSDIRRHGVTRAHLLDPLIPLLMKQPESDLDRKHAVPVMYTAAGYYPEFEARFGVRILPLYDMSELTVALHYPPGEPRKTGSCGKESGLFDVRIVDENNCELPAGVDGEIVVRPRYPSVMYMGYYNDPEQTVQKWRDLWYHTGDRGRVDEAGYFYFLGRLGDRIRRRGVNISAEQIEAVALEHPAILECAAIAVPSPMGEDDIKLCAKLVSDATTTAEDVAAYLLEALPKAMAVRYVEIFDELPKTQTEKVKRAALRDLGECGLTAQTWDHENGAYVTR
ncbi:MAG: AMP-binding protein [Candidatus Velthaea sp.]